MRDSISQMTPLFQERAIKQKADQFSDSCCRLILSETVTHAAKVMRSNHS